MAIMKLKNDNTAWTINGDDYINGALQVYGNVIANNIQYLLFRYNETLNNINDKRTKWTCNRIATKSSITVSTSGAWMTTGLTFTAKPGNLYGLYCAGVANRGFQIRNSSNVVHYTYYRSYAGGYTTGFAHLCYMNPNQSSGTYTLYVYPTATGTITNAYVYEIPLSGSGSPNV